MPLRLNVITASTRPGRIGPAIAAWFHTVVREDGRFELSPVDLADFELPVFDEPRHPAMQQYEHDHTKRWAGSVASADAFVFVAPEYNYGPTPALLNALDLVYKEWNYKPAGFVSYGGLSGGIRSVENTKHTLTTLRMVPVLDAVTVQFAWNHIKDGVFQPEQVHVASARALLAELYRWAEALKPMRS